MHLKYDLHTHSTASDGTLAPAELVRRAVQFDIQVLALTDHDTIAGVAEAAREAQIQGIGFVPGVEISATWSGCGVHIVGLGVDPDCAILNQGLDSMRAYRLWRARDFSGKELSR